MTRRQVAFIAAPMPLALPRTFLELRNSSLIVVPDVDMRRVVAAALGADSPPVRIVRSFPFFRSVASFMSILGSTSSVVIFHECCWPSLDLALAIVRPKGSSYEIVDMERVWGKPSLVRNVWALRPAVSGMSVRSASLAVARHLMLAALFRRYRRGQLQARSFLQRSLVRQSLHPTSNPDQESSARAARPLLVVTGNEDMRDTSQIEAATRLVISTARKFGLEVTLKDHPRKANQLPTEFWSSVLRDYSSGVTLLDPSFPAELVAASGIGVCAIVGFGSSSLGLSDCRAISLMRLIDRNDFAEAKLRHLYSLSTLASTGGQILIPDDEFEVETIIEEIAVGEQRAGD